MASTRLSHSIVYNLAGTLAPIGIMLLTVPIYLHTIGPARFGIMSLVWLLFGYFGLFDFGLSRATANRLAQLRAETPDIRAPVFYTSLLVNGAIGLVLGGVFCLIALPLIGHLSPRAGGVASELPGAIGWFAALFPLALIGNVFIGTLEAEERFLDVNIQQLIGTIGLQCLPLLAVNMFGVRLESAAAGAFVARALSVSWSGVAAMRDFQLIRPKIDLAISRGLMRYGGWVAVTNMVSPILESVDQFVIGAMLGAPAIGHYAVPYSVATKILMLPSALSRALFPRLSSLDRGAAEALTNQAFRLLAWAMTLGCAPAILIAPFAFKLWLGAGLSVICAPIAQVLLAGLWLNGMAFLPYTLLQGQGRPDLVAKFHLIEVIPFLALLWFATATLGLVGAAGAWSLRVALDFGLLFKAIGPLRTRLIQLVPMATFMMISGFVSVFTEDKPVLALTIAMGELAAIIFAAIAFDKEIGARARMLSSRFDRDDS